MTKQSRFAWSQVLGYGLAGLVGAGVAVVSQRSSISNPSNSAQSTAQSPNMTAINHRLNVTGRGGDGDFVAVAAKKVEPAVVRIDTEQVIQLSKDPALENPILRRFFGMDNAPMPQQRELRRGIGSGFIVDRNGILLTNAHVVKGADKVTVTLIDGRTFQGTVRGTDELMDLAVVKIDPKGQELPVVPLGSSDQVEVGDWAITVGNPLGLNNTVTLGIVSNLSRSSNQVGIPEKRLDFIQTDAAINPGNSGGPLLNKAGEVIGINTAIRSDAQGIGFAIPINTVKAVQPLLADGKSVPYPYLGVQMATITPEIAQMNNRRSDLPFQIPEVAGVLVIQVQPNATAATAGVRPGDVFVELNGQPITKAEQIQQVLAKSQVGQTLQVKARRGDQTLSLSIRVGNLRDTSNE